jgi:hypothetical protein
MQKYLYPLCLAAALCAVAACKKDPAPPTPPAEERFRVHVHNHFNELQGRYALWLSDADGRIRAFRWLPAEDSAQIEVPDSRTLDRFDCTIARIAISESPGLGTRDTSITLQTYALVPHDRQVQLRNQRIGRMTDLSLNLLGVSTLDSIIVADGLTFAKPLPANNFNGLYQVLHTGRIWMRMLVNGEENWRFLYFDGINTPAFEVNDLDVNIMPIMFVKPTKVQMPFAAAWQYNVDGVVDTAGSQFLPLGDLRRAPGGAVPAFATLDVFEPIANSDFMPEPLPYGSYRIAVNGTGEQSDAYTYLHDAFYTKLPAALPTPAFDLEPTIQLGDRFAAVRCLGDFDLLTFVRQKSGTQHISWEAVVQPQNGGIVSYRLPDVPKELGDLYPVLKNYNFGNTVRVRAEHFARYSDYEAIVSQRLVNTDPLWRAKGGYIAREEQY